MRIVAITWNTYSPRWKPQEKFSQIVSKMALICSIDRRQK